ncbi:unannotated protein [freshwater metagenome]|uniref:Unannotated protein n=1 Tax=freshwater metagenome TaxID=449393 RepID=A0A6J6EA74_9ZZZZ
MDHLPAIEPRATERRFAQAIERHGLRGFVLAVTGVSVVLSLLFAMPAMLVTGSRLADLVIAGVVAARAAHDASRGAGTRPTPTSGRDPKPAVPAPCTGVGSSAFEEGTHMDDATDPVGHARGAAAFRQHLRGALTAAMKARDQVRVSALRAGIAAIDDAESVDTTHEPASVRHAGGIAGASAGLGATEAARRELSADQVAVVVRTQVDERLAAAEEYERAGAPEQAARLRQEAEVLAAFLTG